MRVFLWTILLIFFIGCGQKNMLIKPLKRVALVIGNQNYKHEDTLKNPINDAKAMAQKLKKLNFHVIDGYDISSKEFTLLLENFQQQLDSDTIAFFYFAGHGNTLQPSSIESYLLMNGEKQETLVSIYKLYDYLWKGKAKYNLICLDACRNYRPSSELEKDRKVVFRGGRLSFANLEKLKIKVEKHKLLNAPDNTLTIYATRVNEGANDESLIDSTHSPFTRVLLKHLDEEGVSFIEVLRRVRKDMNQELNGKQRSSEMGDLSDYIFLNPKKGDRPLIGSF